MPRVFISYARGIEQHEAAVRRLRDLLRANGVDARTDLTAAEEPQDWPAWMEEQVGDADFVLVVASAEYKERSKDAPAEGGRGRGVGWETRLIRGWSYRNQARSIKKILPVVLPDGSEDDVPEWIPVPAYTVYYVEDFTLVGAERLIRYLTGQPHEVDPPLGAIPHLPPRAAEIGGSIAAPRTDPADFGSRDFIPVEEFFEPLRNSGRVFHHRSTLVGREHELAELTGALDVDGTRVAVLSGPGGRGKSRLLLAALDAFAQTHPQVSQFVWNGTAVPDEQALAALPALSVVVVEDAQRSLEVLDVILRHAHYNERMTVLVTCRPSAVEAVREAMVQARFDRTEFRVIEMEPLPMLASRSLVRGAADAAGLTLHPAFEERLAEAGTDCPLIPVVTVGMIANGTLLTADLSGNVNFRQEVLDRFGDVMRSGIPGATAREAGEIFAVVAALSPLNLDDDELVDAVAGFLGLSKNALLQRLDVLVDHGALTLRGREVRVVPDVLGDESLTKAAIRAQTPTGYVRRLWDALPRRCAAALLLNVAELDWRVGRQGIDADLIGAVWDDFERELLDSDALGRRAATPLLRDLSGPQPERLVPLIEHLLANPAADGEVYGIPVTEAEARLDLAPALSVCVRTGPQVRQRALDLLWGLARSDARPPNQFPEHPRRVLEELGQFSEDGDDTLQEALFEAVKRWLTEPADDELTPVVLLTPLVAKEGTRDRYDQENNAVVITAFLVQPEAVTDLRDRIRSVAVAGGLSEDVRLAADAVRLLGDALHGVHGYFGEEPPESTPAQWQTEDANTMTALETVASGTTEPAVRLVIRDAVDWHAASTERDDPLRTRARALIATIDRDEPDGLLTAVIASGYRDMAPRGATWLLDDSDADKLDFEADQRRRAAEIDRAADELWTQTSTPASLVAHLADRAATVHAAGLGDSGLLPLMDAVVRRRPDQLHGLLDALQNSAAGLVDLVAHIPLERLRLQDERAFKQRLTAVLDTRPTLAHGALNGWPIHQWLVHTPASAAALRAALTHSQPPVRAAAALAAGHLLEDPRADYPRLLLTCVEPGDTWVGHAIGYAAAPNRPERWLASLDEKHRRAIDALRVAARPPANDHREEDNQ